MTPANTTGRWKNRGVLATFLAVAVIVLPIACSVASALAIEHWVAEPGSIVGLGLWWLAVLAASTAVFFVTERLARRVLPLAVLLKMDMVFPGQAPKRLAVARRAGSVRDLARKVEDARTHGLSDEPTLAAEKIVTLAASLNAHDRTTRGHAERVRAFTDMIADELRLLDTDRDKLRWSSLLHDIGKLAVHPDILNKSGPLSHSEWEIIRRHPLEGAKLTSPIAPWLGQWANTIAEHHERFDGRGYPRGVSGRQISFGGRIVAVADSYDVMTSARSYKRSISPENARKELAACAGSQFDPEVVRAFLAVSIWRLRMAAPLSWLGSISFGRVFGGFGRIGSVAGHSIFTGAAAGMGVLGLTITGAVASPLPASSHTNSVSAATRSGGSTLNASGVEPTSRQGSTQGPRSGGSSKSGTTTGKGSTDHGSKSTSGSATTTSGPSQGSGTSSGNGTTTSTGAAGGSPSSPTTTPPPPTASLVILNGGGVVGRADLEDEIIVTYSVAPNPHSFCSAWSPTSFPDLVSSNVVVNADEPLLLGDDQISSVTDNADCSGGFHFGSIDLGQRGYFPALGTQTFGGLVMSGAAQCSSSQIAGCTRIHWNGSNTLTITLGQPAVGDPTQGNSSVAVYTPNQALGVSGTIASTKRVQF